MKHFYLFSIILAIVLATSYIDAFTRTDFPEDFLFGAATSAYQWEGAVDEDGRTPSVWDTSSHCHNGSNGDIACDGYHKYKEDVKLMADMGLEAFRFSISWSRLIPNGRGPINPKGLLFYKNLIKELRSHGIEPHVTLYHYDLPQSLEDEYGGWINRKIIEDFTAFADVCFREFGDDVKLWTTINEATIFAFAFYGEGIKFGHCSPTKYINCSTGNSCMETYIAGHNMLLAHASASSLYKLKYKSKQRGSIGLSIFSLGLSPYTNSKDDEIATQRAKAFLYGWMLKPLVYGDYPDEMKRTLGSRLPVFSKEESEKVKGSSDFVGIIHYTTVYVTNRPAPYIFPSSTNKGFFTDMGAYIISAGNSSSFLFDAIPWGLEGILEHLKQSYNNPPIYILENGTPMKHDSMLQDRPRVEYIQAYIGAVLNAIKNGSDMRGYFVWSLIDLYEITVGYTTSFGMYYVNFSDPGRKRSPKLSASWYTGFLNGTIDVASQDITQLQSNFSAGSSSL
ncbi:Glycoside hydrolase superfamily [Arabidopsis suecica]|uniref:beta-glucosidase n=1 Tax=Arabidopsis suecica TaxID=45249 RepID=A0A8T2A3K2_ARASU|nr:Glycoside hydrolase superfamily [Arabidopsis suecica]